jgi:hypothetical protein
MRAGLLVAFLGIATASHATLDMTGDWTVLLTPPPAFGPPSTTCDSFVQTGTSLTMTPCASGSPLRSGTVDPMTGSFNVSDAIPCTPAIGPTSCALSGVVAADGFSFAGQFCCAVPTPTQCDGFCDTAAGVRHPPGCGNGTADTGEQCDNGPTTGLPGDCCSPTCQFRPAGSACPDDGNACNVDACDGAGTCSHSPFPCCGSPEVLGPEGGCRPPTKRTARCADTVAKRAARLEASIIKCHRKAAAAGLRGRSFDEETCEATARSKYDAGVKKPEDCPPCLVAADIAAAATTHIERTMSAVVYCDTASGAPLGDADDGGFVPTVNTAKCEDGVARAVAKLAGMLTKCHVRTAGAAVAGTSFDEQGCETGAASRYDTATATLSGCPPCLDLAGARAAMRDGVIGTPGVNGLDAAIYCQSPGGAFVE